VKTDVASAQPQEAYQPVTYRRTSCATWGHETPRVRGVRRRSSCLNAFSAFALTWRRVGWRPVQLQPKHVRRHGRSTALLAALTTSVHCRFKDRVTLARARAPARALLT
jgi:hypothetical protein